MPRITPNTGGSAAGLQDFEPYVGYLTKKPEIVNGNEKYPDQRLEVTIALVGGDPKDTLKDWLSLKLGNTVAGDASKLRAFLNACAGKPQQTEIKWFDSDTLEWGYDDAPYSTLTEGLEVQFRGGQKLKSDGTTTFRIKTYQAPPAVRAGLPPPPPGSSATFSQISPDGKHGWNGTAWIEIPAAAAPPPPPAPTVVPPPPPAPTGALSQTADTDPDEIPF